MEMPTLRRLRTSRRTVDALRRAEPVPPDPAKGNLRRWKTCPRTFIPCWPPARPGKSWSLQGSPPWAQGRAFSTPRVQSWCWGTGELTWVSPRRGQAAGEDGAYVVVFPDRKYASTLDGADFGSLEARFEGNGAVLTPCTLEGADRIPAHVQSAEPKEPETAPSGWTRHLPPPC